MHSSPMGSAARPHRKVRREQWRVVQGEVLGCLRLLVVMKCSLLGGFLVSVALRGDGCVLGFIFKGLFVVIF